MKLYPCHAGQPNLINGRSCPATPGHARPGAPRRSAYPARFALGVLLALACALGVTAPTVASAAPTASDNTVTTNEDTDYPFTAANFKFSGVNDGDTLASVLIVTLPSPDQGVLGLGHAPVSANTRVSKAQLDANSLVYIPPANANGMDYANFTFKVSDGAADSASPNTMTITVAAVSDPPTASDSKVTTYENRDYTFTATDFSFADVDGDTLTSVRIVTLPKSGTGALQFNGGNIGPRHSISRKVLDAGRFTYRPPTNASGAGYASFTFTVHDDHLPSELTYTMTITVLPDVAPTASDNTVTTNEDTDYPFTAADFLFADADSAYTLASVKIVTLPGLSKGLLKLDGEAVSASDIVTKTQLDARGLTYVPPTKASGMGYASFAFQVYDGHLFSASRYIMTITVLPDAPTARDGAVTATEDTDYPFTAANFNFSDDNGGDTLASVLIVTLPSPDQGVLGLGHAPVSANTRVSKAQLDANSLVYIPPANANGMDYANFTFKVSDGAADSASPNTMTITVAAVSDPPTASDSKVTTYENRDYTFTATDFSFADVDGDTLTSVRIVTLPKFGTGALQFNGGNIGPRHSISRKVLDAGRFTYRPPTNASGAGYASFTFTVHDDHLPSELTYTMTITVLPEVAPTASDNTVTTNEDTDYPFTAADFLFADADSADTLASVKIVTLPGLSKGLLKLDGVDVSASNIVTKTQLDARHLTYVPPADANGVNYASFTFRVNDGAADSALLYTMTITVRPNVAPTASDNTVTTNEDTDYTFTADNFNFSDDNGRDTLASVSLVTLPMPDKGTLMLDGSPLTGAVDITKANLDDGHFTYAPPANANGINYASFTFTVNDGAADSASTYTMTITVTAVNDPPTASDNTVTTNEDTDYTFSSADFNFFDVEGDGHGIGRGAVEIMSLPTHGTGVLHTFGTNISIGGLFARNGIEVGKLAYTPPADANGVDYASFTFRVEDADGLTSPTYTMTITVLSNVAPTASDNTVTTNEDTDYTFTADNFNFSDKNDRDTLASVSLVTLPMPNKGTLMLDGSALTGAVDITKANLDDGYFTYAPPANANGMNYASFTFRVNDGAADSALTYTMTITVLSNVAPTASDNTVTTNEDTDYAFTADNFNFSDDNGRDTLASVSLVTLPMPDKGTLMLDGSPLTGAVDITKANLDDGHFTYAPPANANGMNYASFTFRVNDGAADSALPYTMTITVTAVNDPPTASNNTVTTNEDTDYTFSSADFNFADVERDGHGPGIGHGAVEIMSLPTHGTGVLQTFGTNISIGGLFARNNIEVGELAYTPPADANGVDYASFTFRVEDADGLTSPTYTMTITVLPNVAPTASDNTVTTNEDTDYTFTADNFNFSDKNDRDTLASVSLVTLPGADTGVLTLNDATVSAGDTVTRAQLDANDLIYAPPADANGMNYASFTFRVNDGAADSALPYTMTITVTAVNDPPTASNNTVTTNEDTDYTFSSADFNFFDVERDGHGIGRGAVEIMSLPTHGTGVLQTYGTNISIGGLFARNNIEVGELAYTPPADANGVDYASFTFRVEDADGLTSPTYTMTITVTAVNDPPTGQPTISGTALVGQTLTADTSDIEDVDGLVGVSYRYQWIRVDGAGTGTDISGATSRLYQTTVDDLGKTLRVKATFTDDGGNAGMLTSVATGTVGLPVVRIVASGASVTEGTAATFTLTADPAPDSDITVTVTVTDSGVFAGGGQTGERTVTIPAGNTSATLTVATLNDTTDEPNGAITAAVTGGIGYSVHNTAHTASVTVNDNDSATSMERALPAWLARFGRTVTDQVLEAVTDRLAAPRSPGMKVSLAGRALPIRGQDNTVREDRPHGNAAGSLRASLAERGALDALSNWISHTGAVGDDLPHGAPGAGSRALQSWSPTGRDLTFGTSFALTGEPRADGSLLSVWGRGAMTHFAGRDGGLALDGEAQTLLVGAERAGRGWTTGGVLGRSRVKGGYRSATETGEIEATLTGVYPWAGQAVNDQVSAWAALGYGAGDLRFQPEDGDPVRTDLSLALGAVGLRGEVLRPLESGGLSLAVKGDVRVTRTSSKAAGDTMVGRLMAAEADVWRVRAGVEGARSFMANDDPWATVTPSFEVGVRLDGGDAETGFGADVGGGVALVDPGRGVTLEMKARGLAAHEDEGFREWGASAALAWEPRPQSGRGLSLSLTQSWGASSSGGMDALLSRDTLVGLAASDTAPAGRRLEAELGYAMTVFGGDFTATPNAGLTLTEDGRDWRLGWRLTPAWPDGSGFDVDLDATRSETGDGTPAHAVTLRGALRF